MISTEVLHANQCDSETDPAAAETTRKGTAFVSKKGNATSRPSAKTPKKNVVRTRKNLRGALWFVFGSFLVVLEQERSRSEPGGHK